MKASNWRFAVHFGMHPDELLAVWLFMTFGRRMFSGIENADIWEVSDEDLARFRRGRTEQQVRDEDHVISVGIGGGAFDEHGKNGKARKPGTSAALKVAEFLGVAEDPTILRMLAHVTKNDSEGGREEWEFAQNVCDLNRSLFAGNPNRLYAWAEVVFESKRVRQVVYLAAEKIAKAVDVSQMRDGIRAARLDFMGREDNAMVHSLLLGKADVVVIRRPTGHVQIYSRKGQIDLDNVAAEVRYGEMRVRNQTIPRDVELGQDGTLECVPNWHYQQAAGWIFNGSLSHPGHKPTALKLEQVCSIVAERVRRVSKPEPKKVFGPAVIGQDKAVA